MPRDRLKSLIVSPYGPYFLTLFRHVGYMAYYGQFVLHVYEKRRDIIMFERSPSSVCNVRVTCREANVLPAVQNYITNDKVNVAGIVLAGSADFKVGLHKSIMAANAALFAPSG